MTMHNGSLTINSNGGNAAVTLTGIGVQETGQCAHTLGR